MKNLILWDAVVAHQYRQPSNQEVRGLNSAVHWTFFLLLLSFPTFLHQFSAPKQVPPGNASLTVCCESNLKNGCLAAQPNAK